MCKDNGVFDEWCGEGWYTVSRGCGNEDFTNEGAVWLEDAEELRDLVNTAKNTMEEDYCVGSEYHGSDVLPDECLTTDANDWQNWQDVDPQYLTTAQWYAIQDLAHARVYGDAGDIAKAIEDFRDVTRKDYHF